MAFPKYIAWVTRKGDSSGWDSIAIGSMAAVKTKAREVINSRTWREMYPDGGKVRITRDGTQAFCTAFVID